MKKSKKTKETKEPAVSPELQRAVDLSGMVSSCLAVDDLCFAMLFVYRLLTDGPGSLFGKALEDATREGRRGEIQVVVYKTPAEMKREELLKVVK